MDTPIVPTVSRARANAQQRAASDPAVSAFVSASAGSGKTKLLTDRVLRLLLGGADPARIQCLTYTRAAAAEMALRLQSVLGEWVGLDDTALDARLRDLAVVPNADGRRRARALFADVLDLPGGMRIGTIHAFCQSLLRRFPLEAGVSPHFGLLEDADARLARAQAEEEALAPSRPRPGQAPIRLLAEAERSVILADVAGNANLRRFDTLVRDLLEDRARLALLLDRTPEQVVSDQRAALGASDTPEAWSDRAVRWPDEAKLRDALRLIADRAPPTAKVPAADRLAWLGQDPEARRAGWEEYASSYFTKDGKQCSWKTLAGERLGKDLPHVREAMEVEQARVAAIRDALRAHRLADLSAAFLALALPVASRYVAGKEATLRLDYADLIERTTALLRDPGAAWVLYKLDGGIDHLLLDEVQDTAPGQWEIAGALAEEFFAGAGARDVPRTVFAVGDRKQSIFSFQGAEPAAFDQWRGRLGRLVREAGRAFRDVGLDVSFRSTAPVLALVDQVFADPARTPGVGAPPPHVSDRAGQAGLVEVWPLAPRPDDDPPDPWQVPRRARASVSAPQLLAETVAEFVAEELRGKRRLPSRNRPIRAGDVLILLRSRKLAPALVRCLKQRGVPVAGLDRMVLTEQPAVMDLLALCDVLLLPQDDYALACVLTSPLGGLDDEDLIALAPGRTGSLWDALHARADERPAWRACVDFLDNLFARVDYVSPHALLAEALGPLGGRARLLERLGPEAAEPIDEVLAAALTYARTAPPTLQGFLHWLRATAAEVKREAHGDSGAAGLVRVMTVHGAKGLQAPLVVLPDTTARLNEDEPLLWASVEGREVPIWCPHVSLRCEAAGPLRDAAARARAEEQDRLLYVALTRAEDRLVVCGAAPKQGPPERSWYSLVAQAMRALPVRSEPFRDWGDRLCLEAAQDAPPDREDRACEVALAAELPPWAGTAPDWRATVPPPEPVLPARLAPSRPEGAGLGPVPPAASPLNPDATPDARFARGRLIHTLLQHLPELPADAREQAARRWVARQVADAEAAQAVIADVLAVLADPALATLFGPEGRAEVPLTGVVDGVVVGGLVDRLALLPDCVLVADYKTGRLPPDTVERTPVRYLRQMAAYRAVLRAAYPGRAVTCLLVWTTGPRVVSLPDGLLDSHAPGAPTLIAGPVPPI